MNLLDDRVHANSQMEATNLSIETLKKTKCLWCDSLATGTYKILGTEELPVLPRIVVLRLHL